MRKTLPVYVSLGLVAAINITAVAINGCKPKKKEVANLEKIVKEEKVEEIVKSTIYSDYLKQKSPFSSIVYETYLLDRDKQEHHIWGPPQPQIPDLNIPTPKKPEPYKFKIIDDVQKFSFGINEDLPKSADSMVVSYLGKKEEIKFENAGPGFTHSYFYYNEKLKVEKELEIDIEFKKGDKVIEGPYLLKQDIISPLIF